MQSYEIHHSTYLFCCDCSDRLLASIAKWFNICQETKVYHVKENINESKYKVLLLCSKTKEI